MTDFDYRLFFENEYYAEWLAVCSPECWRVISLVSRNFAKLYVLSKHFEPFRQKVRDKFTVKNVDKEGNVFYTLCGKLHREFDLPALITVDGQVSWYYYGHLSRGGDKPAYISRDTQKWAVNGLIGRESDQPSIVTPFFIEYFKDGLKTRVGSPAVIFANNVVEYWSHGRFQRRGKLLPQKRAAISNLAQVSKRPSIKRKSLANVSKDSRTGKKASTRIRDY